MTLEKHRKKVLQEILEEELDLVPTRSGGSHVLRKQNKIPKTIPPKFHLAPRNQEVLKLEPPPVGEASLQVKARGKQAASTTQLRKPLPLRKSRGAPARGSYKA
jgi:hypothetical protein